jgi:hypothetical protein
MSRTFNEDLDSNVDPQQTLARARGESDHLSLHKRDVFRITGVIRLFPEPIALVDPADPTYPFVMDVAGAAKRDDDGRFRITTPDLKQDKDETRIQGNLYMLNWDPQSPPPERPGPHYKVFP